MRKTIDIMQEISTRNLFNPYFLFFRAERGLYKRLLSKYAYGKVLDVGCGSCNYKSFLLNLKSVDNYFGLDYPEWGCNFSRSQLTAEQLGVIGKIGFRDSPLKANIYGDGCLLGVKSMAVDTVLSLGVLEHVSKPLLCLKEIVRVMKRGGILFLTIPFLYEAHGQDDASGDFYRWTKSGIRLVLEDSGFRVKEILCYGKAGTMLSQLINSFIIKRLEIYNPRRMGFLKLCKIILMIPLFFAVNIISLMLDLLKEDYSYTSGFCIIAVKI